MSVNLSIKNAPEEVVRLLKERAARHRRSLQGEMLAILEDAVRPPRVLTPGDVLAEVRRLGLHSPDESRHIVRETRDDG
jgi:plasmid stability protein